jgi:zinc/manganese transport system substrate-binding protein/manganese/iron transport system substrate-binding protein
MVLPRPSARLAFIALCCAAPIALVACGSDASGGRPVVAATAPQIDGMVRALAGPGIDVESVVSATADVHEIELQPSQARALRKADVIFRPGRSNDAWTTDALEQVDGRQVDVAEGLAGNQRHWWMDPALDEEAATRVVAELDKLDPAGKAARTARLKSFVSDLQAVDAETKRCLATVPADERLIVTDHDAAGAYAERYGLTVVGTISPGADPEAAPSAQRLVELERTMLSKHVTALFPIAPHGSALSSTVAQRGGAKLGDPLWADALPTPPHQATLLEAAKLNGASVAEALGATPAACGSLLAG